MPVAIIGARLYYILFDLQYYIDDPSQIFNIRSGGIAIYGALIAGDLAILFLPTKFYFSLDLLRHRRTSVLLAQGIGRWGNFMNHEAFGAEVSRSFLESLYILKFIIDNMYIDEAYRQPTFLYESVWNVIDLSF